MVNVCGVKQLQAVQSLNQDPFSLPFHFAGLNYIDHWPRLAYSFSKYTLDGIMCLIFYSLCYIMTAINHQKPKVCTFNQARLSTYNITNKFQHSPCYHRFFLATTGALFWTNISYDA